MSSISSELGGKELLLKAERLARPKTWRIARFLDVLAAMCLLLTLFHSPVMALLGQAGEVLAAAVSSAWAGISWVLSAAGGLILVLLRVIALNVLSRWETPVIALVGLGVHVAWYRARVHVMHKAVRLVLESSTVSGPGEFVRNSFVRTHARFERTQDTLVLLSFAGVAVTAFPPLAEELGGSGVFQWQLPFAWCALLIGCAFSQLMYELKNSMIGAYALAEACPVPRDELKRMAEEHLLHGGSSNVTFLGALRRVQNVGLAVKDDSGERTMLRSLLDPHRRGCWNPEYAERGLA